MKQQLGSVGLALAVLAVAPACFATSFADPLGHATAGINSVIFLNSDSNIYELHGNQLVNTFPMAYGGGNGSFDELAMGIINGNVVTHSSSTLFAPAGGGQYTLSGTPTGVASFFYNDPSLGHLGMSGGGSLTSDGANLYFLASGSAGLQMFESNADFSNPTPLFSAPIYFTQNDNQVAYDPINQSLWVDDGGTTAYDLSLSGNVLSSFQIYTGGVGVGRLMTFDPTDGTLWFGQGGGSSLSYTMEQYSTTGQQLQYGTIPGFEPGQVFALASADDSVSTVPEPGTLLLMGTGLASVARRLRRRKAA